MERRGAPRKRPRQGGSLFFLVAIGVVVAGAGVAGLRYRNQLWDDHGHPDHVATSQDSSFTPTFAPVTLTNADELVTQPSAALMQPSTVIGEPEATDAGAPSKPPAPKPAVVWKPKPKPQPAKAEPKKEDQLPSEAEIFGKPE